MKIAAISHSCVIDVNQQIYVELLKHPGVEMLLIAPNRWYSSLRGDTVFEALPELRGYCKPLHARFAGSIHFHWYPRLGDALAEFRPDIIFADEEPYSLVTTQALQWQRRLNCKFAFYTKQNLYKQYLPPFSFMQARALARADHALVISEEAAEVLRQKGYKGSLTELPHGVDPELVKPKDSSELRARLGIQGPVIGYLGRIAAEKGVWDLLTAARILVKRMGPVFTVVLIGDGPARERLADAARVQLPPGLFRFTGSVAHNAVPDYLNLMDMLVLPSRTQTHWKEQFGRVLVEASGCGIPLVGSSSGHIPSLINRTAGGLIFREGDPTDLADKMQTLLEDPELARKFGENGRRAVLAEFTYEKVAGVLYEALSQTVSG
ncbi:MAG: glycosyltransferase family 4 protein [Armatimonadetes bacterium]|nr:glycosyltransferase family 4 protein [Armatimonadota bacterium]